MLESHKIILLLHSVLVGHHQEKWDEESETPGEPSRECQNYLSYKRQVFRKKTERSKD